MEDFSDEYEEQQHVPHKHQKLGHTSDDGSGEEEQSPPTLAKTAAQKKLLELRAKLGVARHANKQIVKEEEQKVRKGETAGKIAKDEREAEKESQKQKLISVGLDPEKEKVMGVTASEAEWWDQQLKRKEKTKGVNFGWERYNEDAQYRAYNRRLNEATVDEKLYNDQKSQLAEDQFYAGANNLNYGQTPNIPKEKVDKMAAELEKTISKRKNYSRKREHFDEAYVDYINERNARFNKKLARAFDSYTMEIKQNLERGTAI